MQGLAPSCSLHIGFRDVSHFVFHDVKLFGFNHGNVCVAGPLQQRGEALPRVGARRHWPAPAAAPKPLRRVRAPDQDRIVRTAVGRARCMQCGALCTMGCRLCEVYVRQVHTTYSVDSWVCTLGSALGMQAWPGLLLVASVVPTLKPLAMRSLV